MAGVISLVGTLVAVATSVNAMTLEEASASVKSLCTAMPSMAGCGLVTTCSAAPPGAESPYCDSFSVLREICVEDGMQGMKGCDEYTNYCTQSHAECDRPVLPHMPTTIQAQKQNEQICKEMAMDGCDDSGNSLLKYAKLCREMPGMGKCSPWSDMCNGIQNIEQDALRDLCYQSSHSIQAGVMIMYFHQGIHDTLLFKELTPETYAQYAWCCIASIFVGLLAHALGTARPFLETKINERLNASLTTNTASDKHLLGVRTATLKWQSFHFVHDLLRGVLAMAHIAVAYVAMLIAMTYNTGYFLCIVLGFGLGAFFFTRFTSRPPGGSSDPFQVQNETYIASCCE